MSLVKGSCERCWLPPLPHESLCRKCRGAPPHELSKWIRYHTPSPTDCCKYRKILNEDSYYGSVIPQECLSCCNFILGFNSSAWTTALKQHIYQITHNELALLFMQNIEDKKDLLLDYVDNLLELHQADVTTCKKIVNALVYASNNRDGWILEELVLRPSRLHVFLFPPIQLLPHIPEDLYGQYTTLEEWWIFWEKIPSAAQRRIRFRCLKYKDELIETTWSPERVLSWCVDIATKYDIRGAWSS